jgi:hypothetical protein
VSGASETLAITENEAAQIERANKNENVTELVEMKGRGHALTIDGGWQEVADTALAFVKRFV